MAAMRWVLGLVGALTGDAHRENGQAMAEYGLILGGVAVIAMVGLTVIGPAVTTLLSTLAGDY